MKAFIVEASLKIVRAVDADSAEEAETLAAGYLKELANRLNSTEDFTNFEAPKEFGCLATEVPGK